MTTVSEKKWTASKRNVIKDTTTFHEKREAIQFFKKKEEFYKKNKHWEFKSNKDDVITFVSCDGKTVCWLYMQEEN